MSIIETLDGHTYAESGPATQRADGGRCVDILGIGFGPANLALAIAVEEDNANRVPAERISARFVELREQFGWHDGMLLPGTTMQISFLKDLVSQREPTSSYSFLNYLQHRGRLTDFINLKTFFPTQHEFRDYLGWAAERVTTPVDYGVAATRIDWNGSCFEVSVRSSKTGGSDTILARDIVIGAGIRAVLPDHVTASRRVFHNHGLLPQLADVPSFQNGRFVVVGSGQSAAEVAAYLHDSYPTAEVHVSFRRFGYTPSDDTPYANRIFDPGAVDEFYSAPSDVKKRLLDYHWLTNYSAVDSELIYELYRREYSETVAGDSRLVVHRVTDIEKITETPDGVSVTLGDLGGRGLETIDADAVVFATGFEAADVRGLIGPSIDVSDVFVGGRPSVERDYRLRLPNVPGRIFLNGGVQHSHGLTSSLLSNIAIRASDILRSASDVRRVAHD